VRINPIFYEGLTESCTPPVGVHYVTVRMSEWFELGRASLSALPWFIRVYCRYT